MAIRLVRAVLTDSAVNIPIWNALVAAGVSVAECGCGWSADGEPISEGSPLTFASVRCRGCGAEACRPVPVAAVPAG